MYSILLVEDQKAILEINQELLEEVSGYHVETAENLAGARAAVAQLRPDLIVLDINLPDGSGLDFLREIKQTMDIPVLLLTALSESSDEVKGIQEGGDDYVAKPYDNDVLLARIKKLLSQSERVKMAAENAKAQANTRRAADMISYGPLLAVNYATQKAYLCGEDVSLTPKEFAILSFFLKNTGIRLTAEEIYQAVWGQEALDSAGTVRVRIKGLREKLKVEDEVAIVIETVERKYYVAKLCGFRGR
ncbi:MAG: response regulator transcription factor [Oscillospiraceae bacterium]|nr:response regulator transcription factor [Oscillospiraceae bacterium]